MASRLRCGLLALFAGAVGACATASPPPPAPRPVAPPPALEADALADAKSRAPALAAQAELLHWEAREYAAQGDVANAGRSARLARQILDVAQQVPRRRRAPPPAETRTSSATASKEPASPAERPAPRRRKKPAPETTPEDGLAAKIRKLAAALSRQADAAELTPAQRVWLENGRRALLEAQRALAAEAPSRAEAELTTAQEALAALRQKTPLAETPAAEAPALDPLEGLARDLRAAGLEPAASGGAWLIVALPPPEPSGAVSAAQRARLQKLGRLLRVHATFRLTVGAPKGGASTEAVLRFLQVVERLEAERFVEPPGLRVDAPLWVALAAAETVAG